MTAREVTLCQPGFVRMGAGCRSGLPEYLVLQGLRRAVLLTSPSLRGASEALASEATRAGCRTRVQVLPTGEPTVETFSNALAEAVALQPQCIVGVGGGSVLDVAKLVAAFADSPRPIEECFGIGLLPPRSLHLVCLPTTAGTGSEVSPNAILLDERESLKKGVISPHLVPDATFIDAELALGVPARITAFTGIDTLVHCIEAYTNRFAVPIVDMYALEGIGLTARFLPTVVRDGANLEARSAMAMASYLGGLCLGPVNTAAVHALAYPLGSRFHVAHGLSNAVLLAAVMRFNLPAAVARYAQVARALGVTQPGPELEIAEAGVAAVACLLKACDLDTDLAALGVTRDDIPEMASAAFTVQRLLKNNPRDITQQEIAEIYSECFRA